MKLKFIAAAVLTFGVTAANAEVLGLLDMSPLYKEVVAANPGIEAVHPHFEDLDTNFDGRADTIKFQFDVYPVASNVPLFSSPLRTFIYPANPCTNPAWTDAYVEGLKFLGGSVLRSHIAFDIIIECEEAGTFEYKEAHKTIVYSTNVSVPLGATWTKVYNLELISFDGIDVDRNDGGTKELVLTMVKEGVDVPTSLDPANTRTVAMEGFNGTVVFDRERVLFR